MSDMEITIRLPEELVARAQEVGIDIDSLTSDMTVLLEQRIERKQAWRNLLNMADQLEGSVRPEELEAEFNAAKAERINRNPTSKP